MRRIVLAFVVLAWPALADNPYRSLSVGPTITINGQCTTPATGCPAGTASSLPIPGFNNVVATVITSTFTGTLACFGSADGGQNWFQLVMRVNPGNGSSVTAGSNPFVASTATTQMVCVAPFGGITDMAVVSTAPVTNTATVQLTATNAQTNLAYLGANKGSQPVNSTALSVQNLKDSGRSIVTLLADGVTPATAETLITLNQIKAGVQTAGVTTYAITAGKLLRLQSFACTLTAGAATNRVRVALRLNTAGACTAASNPLGPALELSPAYGTAAAAQGGAYGMIPFPDGLDLTGTSWNICMSENAAAASGTLTCSLTGFEY